MSVTDKLNRLLAIKLDIKDAIEQKLLLGLNDNMATYADKIRSISAGLGLYYDGLMAITDMTANDLINGTFLRYVHSSEIESITTRGMNYNPNLESLILPECVFFDNYAFDNCTSLLEVIARKCSYIGDYCFLNCTSLSDVLLGAINKVPVGAFKNCKELEEFDLYGVDAIGDNAFNGCTKLWNVSLYNIDSIGASAFYNTNLRSIYLKNGVTLGNSAFYGTKIDTIDFSRTSSIGEAVCRNCYFLKSANLSGLTNIPANTFNGCWSLLMDKLPTYITYIKQGGAFSGCYSMLSIILDHTSVPQLGTQNATFTDTTYLGIFNDTTVFVPDYMISSYSVTQNWENLVRYGRVRPVSELNNLGYYKPIMLRNRNITSRNLSTILEGATGICTSNGSGTIPLGTYGAGTTFGNTLIAFNRKGAAHPYWNDTRFTYLEVPTNIKSYTATWNSIGDIYPYMNFYVYTDKIRVLSDENKGNGTYTKNLSTANQTALSKSVVGWMPIVLKCIPDNNFTLADLGLSITFTLTDDSTITYNIW